MSSSEEKCFNFTESAMTGQGTDIYLTFHTVGSLTTCPSW